MAKRYIATSIEGGKEVQIGDEVETFRGQTAILEAVGPRRVHCRLKDDTHRIIHEWYPTVIGCRIEEAK